MSTSVKHFYSGMVGTTLLPAYNVGASAEPVLINLLDQCLVNGWGQQTATSVVVSSGVATVTVPTGPHPFQDYVVVLLAGATPAGLNGEKRAFNATGTTFQFDATGVTDGTATGTITVKVAPAGWEKPFAVTTSKAVYRSPNPASSRMFYRVVGGTGSNPARIRGYESMSDVDTGTELFPTVGQLGGDGFFWSRGDWSWAKSWVLIADDRTFYFQVGADASLPYPNQASFFGCAGDFKSFKAVDSLNAVLTASPNTDVTWTVSDDSSAAANAGIGYLYTGGNGVGTFTPRPFNAIGGAINLLRISESYRTTSGFSGATASVAGATHPLSVNNGLLLSRIALVQSGVGLRGRFRGIYDCPQNFGTLYPTRTIIDGQGDFADRKLMAVAVNRGVAGGALFLDITGPWE
jgi:hypothetical protein